MDIGPTELPIHAIMAGEGVRRVEGLSDARQDPQRRNARDEQPGEGEHEAPHDSVDVSAAYRVFHPEHSEPNPETVESALEPAGLAHLDIEA